MSADNAMVTPSSTPRGVTFASMAVLKNYADNERQWEPSRIFWTRPEEMDGKSVIVQWHKFALKHGCITTNNDLHCDITNGGMTLELKSKVPKNFLDPEQEYEAKLNAIWEAQERTKEAKEAFFTMNNREKDALDAIHEQLNRYKKNHEWKVCRIMLGKQVENSPHFFDIYKQETGGWYVKIGLLEVDTDVFVPVKKPKIH